MNNILRLPFYVRFASAIIIIIGLAIITQWAKMIIAPLIIGLLLAIILTPFSRILENKLKFPRSVSAITSTTLFTLLISFSLYFFGTQFKVISDDWPSFQNQILVAIDKLQDWISATFEITNEEQLQYITNNASKSIGIGTSLIETTISSLSSLGMLLIFVFLYTLFILMYRRHIVSFLKMIFTKEDEVQVQAAISDTQVMVKNYLIGLTIQMASVMVMFIVAYSIIGVKYTILLAVMTGILNIIPYIGIIFSMIIAALITFATGTPSQILFVVIAVVIIHAIDGNIIMPRIIGSKVKVNSLAVIIGLVIGEKMWGILGMLLTIPVLAMMKIIFDNAKNLKAWGFLLGEDDTVMEADAETTAYLSKKYNIDLENSSSTSTKKKVSFKYLRKKKKK